MLPVRVYNYVAAVLLVVTLAGGEAGVAFVAGTDRDTGPATTIAREGDRAINRGRVARLKSVSASFIRGATGKFKQRSNVCISRGTSRCADCFDGMIRRAEDCRKKAMECHHRAFACPDPAIRLVYLDLVYQWREIANELEALGSANQMHPNED